MYTFCSFCIDETRLFSVFVTEFGCVLGRTVPAYVWRSAGKTAFRVPPPAVFVRAQPRPIPRRRTPALLNFGGSPLLMPTPFDPPPSVWPHLFCGAGHEKRRGEQLKWSLAFRLYIGSFPCAQLPGPVHTARLGRVCFAYLA